MRRFQECSSGVNRMQNCSDLNRQLQEDKWLGTENKTGFKYSSKHVALIKVITGAETQVSRWGTSGNHMEPKSTCNIT